MQIGRNFPGSCLEPGSMEAVLCAVTGNGCPGFSEFIRSCWRITAAISTGKSREIQ